MHGKHIRPHESLSKLPFGFEAGARSAQEQEVDLEVEQVRNREEHVVLDPIFDWDGVAVSDLTPFDKELRGKSHGTVHLFQLVDLIAGHRRDYGNVGRPVG